MKKGLIYCFKNKINSKCYVGQTTNIKHRLYTHKRNSSLYQQNKDEKGKYCPKFYNAVLKYGWENFEFLILEENIGKSDLDDREVYWGLKMDSVENGYNLKLGGQGNEIHSPELLEKLSIRVTGERNPMYGKTGELNPVSTPIIELCQDNKIIRHSNARCFAEYHMNEDPTIKTRSVNAHCKRDNYIFMDRYIIGYECNFDLDKAKQSYKLMRDKLEYETRPIYELDSDFNVIEIYDNINDIRLKGIKKQIKRVLNKGCNNFLGRKFIFKFEYDSWSKEDIRKRFSHKSPELCKPRLRSRKPIICLNDGMKFSGICEASKFYNIDKDSISKGLTGKRTHCGYYEGEKMYFKYIRDNDTV